MSDRKASSWKKIILRCLLVAVAANATFLLIRLADWGIPRQEMRDRIRVGYMIGLLGLEVYPHDLMSGADQYTDAVTMQIELLGDHTVLTNALAPRVVSPERAPPGATATFPH